MVMVMVVFDNDDDGDDYNDDSRSSAPFVFCLDVGAGTNVGTT